MNLVKFLIFSLCKALAFHILPCFRIQRIQELGLRKRYENNNVKTSIPSSCGFNVALSAESVEITDVSTAFIILGFCGIISMFLITIETYYTWFRHRNKCNDSFQFSLR